MKRILIALLLVSLALAQCDIAERNYDAIERVFEITGNDAEFLTAARMPLEENCLAENNLEVLLTGPAECPSEIYNDIYKGTGKIITNTQCLVTYTDGNLNVAGRGDILLAIDDVAGKKELSFSKWDIVEMNETHATLVIVLPGDVESFEWAPREDSYLKDNFTIVWDPMPEEAPSVIYSVTPEDPTELIVLVVVGFIGFMVLYFIIRFVGDYLSERRVSKKKKKPRK